MVKKLEDMFIRFDRIHERDERTDTQTPHDTVQLPHDEVSVCLSRSYILSKRINIGYLQNFFAIG